MNEQRFFSLAVTALLIALIVTLVWTTSSLDERLRAIERYTQTLCTAVPAEPVRVGSLDFNNCY